MRVYLPSTWTVCYLTAAPRAKTIGQLVSNQLDSDLIGRWEAWLSQTQEWLEYMHHEYQRLPVCGLGERGRKKYQVIPSIRSY